MGERIPAMRPPEAGPKPWWVMVLAALVIGVVAGFGAVAFRGMIAGFHNLFFLGQLSFDYDANVHTPASPWGFFIIFVPVAGAVGVAFLVLEQARVLRQFALVS